MTHYTTKFSVKSSFRKPLPEENDVAFTLALVLLSKVHFYK